MLGGRVRCCVVSCYLASDVLLLFTCILLS